MAGDALALRFEMECFFWSLLWKVELSITKCQSVPQQSCIPYFCSYKNINQKGLKQVQSLQRDTQTSFGGKKDRISET